KIATVELQEAEMRQFIKLLKDKNITVDPTLVVFEEMFTARDKQVSEMFKSTVGHFPLQWQRNIKAGGGGLPVPQGMDEVYRQSFDVFLKITKLLYDNGIRIVTSIDGLDSFTLHSELNLYVKAGIPSNHILHLIT